MVLSRVGSASQVVRLKRRRPLNRHRHHWARVHRGLVGGKATVSAVVVETVFARMLRAPLRLVLAICDGALGPGVLADAGNALEGLGAFGLGPPGIGLRGEAEHVRGPQLLLALRTPALLPSPMTPLRGDVRVVLGGDRTVLPAVPLAGTRPRRLAGVGRQHSLAHDALDGVAGELHEPAEGDNGHHGAQVVPRRHVHLGQGVVSDGIVVAILLLLLELLVGLRRRHEVHDVLKGRGQPRGRVARAAGVEQAAARLLRVVVGLGHRRLRDGVQAEAERDMHEDDEGRDAARDVDHRLVHCVAVHHAQGDRSHEGPADLRGEGSTVLWEHIHAEHDPDARGEAGGAQVGAPDHAKLTDVVQSDPVGERHDQVHHAVQKADAHVRLATPPLLLRIA
mmetsp:Transcript_94232/g.239796  ORF Transcript_94232/g.239796 Transcript_94232/m.239796 type:complete len:394 (+) Transcript_94232:754-1935(+)